MGNSATANTIVNVDDTRPTAQIDANLTSATLSLDKAAGFVAPKDWRASNIIVSDVSVNRSAV